MTKGGGGMREGGGEGGRAQVPPPSDCHAWVVNMKRVKMARAVREGRRKGEGDGPYAGVQRRH